MKVCRCAISDFHATVYVSSWFSTWVKGEFRDYGVLLVVNGTNTCATRFWPKPIICGGCDALRTEDAYSNLFRFRFLDLNNHQPCQL